MDLLIYGASGLAKEIYDIINRNYKDKWRNIFFIDDFVDEGEKEFGTTVHFSTVEKWAKEDNKSLQGIVAVGEPQYRKILAEKFLDKGIKLATVIDKTALISPSAKISDGVIICEMATIHADVTIGRGVLVQPYVDVGHDIVVNNYTVLGPHCAPGGGTVFGECVYAGMHSAIKEGLNIGDGATIGMGAIVYNDVEVGSTVIGNPARVTRGNVEHKVFTK